MSLIKEIRKGYISLRKIGDHSTSRFEIVKYEFNKYYGTAHEYCYDFAGEFYSKPDDRLRIHKSCFEHKEHCYIIAFINKGLVEFIGDRAIDLDSEQDYKNFLWLLRSGINKSIRFKVKLS